MEVHDERGPVALGGSKPRAVLAVLLLNANEPVSSDRLAQALWGDDAPSGAAKTVQVHVSRLRKALGNPDIVATTPAGYCLRLDGDDLDVRRFEQLVGSGRDPLPNQANDVGDVTATARRAPATWSR
ncbi:MAG TPA: winged helix-turn-helix domain-containing protein [Solirubrobacteraceae bacterium]|nr:winged helix-turn-helix domain-containing protein [Solirubrobacteraceae bacterium]